MLFLYYDFMLFVWEKSFHLVVFLQESDLCVFEVDFVTWPTSQVNIVSTLENAIVPKRFT